MKVAITGAGGQLGRSLTRVFGHEAIPLARTQFDVCDKLAMNAALRSIEPTVVINCAAYTHVDNAELHREECFDANAHAVNHLAQACHRMAIRFVQISTDYVFGGDLTHRVPYRENDSPAPQSAYAESKLLGERYAVQCENHLVIRTCGLYQRSGANFLAKMLELSERELPIRVVEDQECTPSYVEDVASAIHFLVGCGAQGTCHVVNGGSTSWFDFAREIFSLAKINVELQPVTSSEFGSRAQRPAYSVLDTQRYHQLGGPPLRGWREAVQAIVNDEAS